MKRTILVAALCAVAALAVGSHAQSPEAVPPAAAGAPVDPKVAALEAQIRQLQSQLATVQQRQVTPEERQAQAERTYLQIFQAAKDEAFASCRKVGGALRVTVQSRPSAALSVTCELR